MSPIISDNNIKIARFRIIESYNNKSSINSSNNIRTQVKKPFKSNNNKVESININNLPLYNSLLVLFLQPPSTATAPIIFTTTIITHLIITTSIAPKSSCP